MGAVCAAFGVLAVYTAEAAMCVERLCPSPVTTVMTYHKHTLVVLQFLKLEFKIGLLCVP